MTRVFCNMTDCENLVLPETDQEHAELPSRAKGVCGREDILVHGDYIEVDLDLNHPNTGKSQCYSYE